MFSTAFTLTLLASLFLLGSVIWFASKRPGYLHRKHTISELGEEHSPTERIVAYFVFLPTGLLLLVISYLALKTTFYGAVLASCLALGYIISALFPCDQGSPVFGSMCQLIHNYVGGSIQYLGGSIALWNIGHMSGHPLFNGVAVFICMASLTLLIPMFNPVRGWIQRIIEVALFLSLATVIWIS